MKNGDGALGRYLVRRGKKQRFYVRLAVPRPLQSVWNKRERIKTLGTSDRDEAERRAFPILAQWRQEEGEALALPTNPAAPALRVPSDDDLEALAVEIAHDYTLDYEDRRRQSLRGADMERWERHADRCRINFETRRHLTATANSALVSELADIAIEELGFDLPRGSERYDRFCQLLNQANLAASETSHQRAQGFLDAETHSKLVARVRDREAAKAKPGESIVELFETYAQQRVAEKGKRIAGIAQDRMVIQQFAEFVGKDRAVGSIAYEDAKAYVDALSIIPTGYKKRKDYRGLSVREAIAEGQRRGAKTLSLITQQRYISTVSPFFAWLASEKGGRRVQSNLFAGLHHDTSRLKGKNRRPSFSAAQIHKIIHSPLFVGFQADGREHLPGNKHANDWRFWLPLICLFTGARIGEAAQLHLADMVKLDGIWCVELREDERNDQRTKSRKCRIVALHSTLLKIGLLGFIERQRERMNADGNPQLFPEFEGGKRDQFGDRPSRWWRGYLDKIGVKSRDGDGFGSHSFRHTMADQLRAAGHLDAVFGPVVLGHSGSGSAVTAGYGETRQGTPQMSQELIESVQFIPIERGRAVEGGKPVDFTHLLVE